jgi:hypothetical protein
MRWRRTPKEAAVARGVVREAERLLEGRTLESFISRRERVPAWSLVGLLAHGSRLDLMRLASPAASPDPAGWSGTVARLASDLLDRAWDELSLTTLQRRSLLPLELGLLGGQLSPPCTPSELYQMVTGSLERPLSPEF